MLRKSTFCLPGPDVLQRFLQDRASSKVLISHHAVVTSLNVPLKHYNESRILTTLSLNLILLISFGFTNTFNVPVVVLLFFFLSH